MLSLNGGVINPMQNWGFRFGGSTGGSEIEGVRVDDKRVARFRTLESRGTSDEAWQYQIERESIEVSQRHTRVYNDGTCSYINFLVHLKGIWN